MKNAKQKLNAKGLQQRNLREVEIDHMPIQVATDLLCDPARRMSSRERRTLQAARARCFVSTAQRIPAEVKLTEKLHDKPIQQIGKWAHRAKESRDKLQAQYAALIALQAQSEQSGTPDPILMRHITGINLRAAQIDRFLDAAGVELANRRSLTLGLTDPKGDFLFDPALRRIFYWSIPVTARKASGRWCRIRSIPDYANPTFADR